MSRAIAVIEELLQREKNVSTREVAAQAGISRQAAQKQLKAMVDAGALTVAGKARAARYSKAASSVNALWAKVAALGEALSGLHEPAPLTFHAQAKLPVDDSVKQTVAVESAGSLFRLSARLLLSDVDCDELTLDFAQVADVGDEFVEEVFEKWAKEHPLTKVRIVNLAPELAARLPSL